MRHSINQGHILNRWRTKRTLATREGRSGGVQRAYKTRTSRHSRPCSMGPKVSCCLLLRRRPSRKLPPARVAIGVWRQCRWGVGNTTLRSLLMGARQGRPVVMRRISRVAPSCQVQSWRGRLQTHRRYYSWGGLRPPRPGGASPDSSGRNVPGGLGISSPRCRPPQRMGNVRVPDANRQAMDARGNASRY